MRIFEQRNIDIDLRRLLVSRMLICANSGAGKSYTIRKIIEEVGSKLMSIILDVEGEFKTLREKHDYLLIGPDGDVPISLKAAHLLPAKLLELKVSTIIDVSDLKLHERIDYVRIFLDSLVELKRKYWKPCLVIVDEAHMYCGQQEKQPSFKAIIDLMTRGRKRGFCGILATQRIAKLHKDAVAETNNFIIGRTSLDIDMKRIASNEILGFNSKEEMFALRNLKPGEFFVYGPAISETIEKVKISEVKTTHPKSGVDLSGKVTPPTHRIKTILSKISDLPKDAEQKAKTLKDLQQRNRQLERELRQKPKPVIDQTQLEAAEKRGQALAEKQYKQQLTQIQSFTEKMKTAANRMVELIQNMKIEPISFTKVPIVPHVKLPERNPSRAPTRRLEHTRRPAGEPTEIDTDVKLNKCERTILSLLYNNASRSFKTHLVALFSGYSPKSGGFKNALAHLNSLELIVRNSGDIQLSTEGELGAPKLLGNDVNLYETFTIENWERILPKCDGKIFRHLMDNAGTVFSKDDIGQATGYSSDSGGFKNSLAHLNALKLIKRSGGNIQLNEEILEL